MWFMAQIGMQKTVRYLSQLLVHTLKISNALYVTYF